jgi:acetolactate synthase-1/2/3 large subunit
MGKGCLREDHPLLLGQTGFWGTPISNDRCRTADLILAVGTRLAEANSSSGIRGSRSRFRRRG